MAITPTNPIVGSTQNGLTSPTYTFVSDVPPNQHSEQFAITTLGGTQTGVIANSVSSPFTLTFERPASFKQLGVPNPVTGVVSNVGRNVYTVRTRKGVTPLTNQPKQNLTIETRISVPAGSELNDTINLKAAMSCHIGALNDQSVNLSTLATDGVL